MLFRRVVFSALLVGVVSGMLLSAVQLWQQIPIIIHAELFEQAESSSGHHTGPVGHSYANNPATPDAGHEPAAAEWAPADGTERTAYTLLANVLTSIGFALLMLVAQLAFSRRRAGTWSDWRQGLLWGVAGYATFFIAPTLGLPPEIPGAAAAPLEARQIWWFLTVACTGVGLACAAFGKGAWRWAALGLLVVPHLLGAPHLVGGPFDSHPPVDAAALAELAEQFVWASVLANAVYWLALGSVSLWTVQRFLKPVAVAE